MNPLLVGVILLLTVVAAMAMGIVLGYGIFLSILHVFGRHQQQTPAAELAPGPASSAAH